MRQGVAPHVDRPHVFNSSIAGQIPVRGFRDPPRLDGIAVGVALDEIARGTSSAIAGLPLQSAGAGRRASGSGLCQWLGRSLERSRRGSSAVRNHAMALTAPNSIRSGGLAQLLSHRRTDFAIDYVLGYARGAGPDFEILVSSLRSRRATRSPRPTPRLLGIDW